jgi:aldose 1-epimerase
MKSSLLLIIAFFIIISCDSSETKQAIATNDIPTMTSKLSVQKKEYDTMKDKTVHQFTLTNVNGIEVRIIEFGGIVTHLFVPDRDGRVEDIVLGFDELKKYQEKQPYFGALIGRYGNRIANSQFELNGEMYDLTVNETPHHLHGGIEGFDKRIWKGEVIKKDDRVGVALKLTSPDGDQGYPGTVEVTVVYTLNNQNDLHIQYEATTDKATPINLTNHSYFNLNGAGGEGVDNHELMLAAAEITAVDDKLIPTGELMAVENTPFDFQRAKPIGQEIENQHPQMVESVGYDHNFVFSDVSNELKKQATVCAPNSGRTMEVWTSELGVQLYVPNYQGEKTIEGKNGTIYEGRAAFCLETQHFPNSPNQADFPNTILEAGDTYRSETIYRFGTTVECGVSDE